MSSNIYSFRIGTIYYQSGYGYPTHIATRGCTYIDVNTGIEYINKDGIVDWVPFLDSSNKPFDIYVTGGTYDYITGIATFVNNSGNTFSLSGFNISSGGGSTFTGGTVLGATNFLNGLTSTTISTNSISATTYYNLPLDITVTGGTYTAGTATFKNNTGGTFSVSGFATELIPHTTASGTDTYTATVSGVTSYNDGDAYLVRFTNGNTTTCTLNINGLGAINLYRNNDGHLIGGDIISNSEMLCVYNSTLNVFQAIGTAPNTLLSYVTNADSVTITKGQIVYAFGGQGDRMTVKLASNTGDTTSARTVGVVLSSSIAANQKGLIMMQGLLDGLSILPTTTYSDGDSLYLGATPGSITKVKPYAPNHLVYVATVTTASNGAAGRMYVNIQNGYELDELHNVVATGATYGDLIVYSASGVNNLWVSTKTLTGNYTINGGLTITGNTSLNGLTGTTISATTYQNLPAPVITGTTNYIPKFTSGTTLTNSLIFDSFSGTGINTSSPIAMLDVKLSATTDYILNLKDTNNNEFFRINKVGGVLINSGATFYGGANFQSTPGIYINGDGSAVYGSNVYNKNIITFMQPFTSNSISGLQAATLNYGNVRCGLYFQNNVSARPELFASTVVEGTTVETFRITEAGSFNIGGLNTDNSRFTIRNSRLGLGSKAFSILNSASTENIYFNDNGNAYFNGNLTATTISGNSLTLSSSASTINLDNPNQQQIRFFSGGTGTPQLTTYSQGAKIIFKDNIDSSVSTGYAIGVDAGSLWYGVDLTGNGHDWYAGTRKLGSLIASAGFQLFGLGGPTTVAFTISGTSYLGSKGGTGYMDFLRVVNNWSGATNVNKWFRTNITGGLEILNDAYTSVILSLTDNGILSVGGGNTAASTSQDATSNYITFNNNNTQIYDDGNTHIHSRGSGQAMWINTNGGQLNLLTQSPTATGGIGSGIAIATGTLNGYVTINTGRTVTTAASYGYLTTGGAGTYPGGSQSVSISLYANNRIWGQEIDAFSDERMKDIQGEITLDDGLKLVNNLKPIKYTWKEGEDKGLKAGYSAQQVIKSGFDHLVSIIPNNGLEETIDEDGFMSPKDTQFSMNYDQVTPYHGVVIKHLLEEIENLKQEINKLTNNNN